MKDVIFKEITLTDLLALWGALLSTVLATIKLADFIKDKAKIKVRIKGNWKVLPKNTKYGDATYIIITATNVGRRPITLTTAFLVIPKRLRKICNATSYICADPDTCKMVELKEGQTHSYFLKQDDIGYNEREFVAGVYDATGRCHHSHGVLRRFLRLKTIKYHK
jgi:hypothetical protein